MVLGVVGLGLMGGSLALALRPHGIFSKMIGCDNRAEHVQEALRLGLVDEAADLDTLVRQSDVIVLAVPVEAIVALMPRLEAMKANAVVLDLGSTKTPIVEAILPAIRPRFVAAHPMAGTEYSGPQAAFPKLYDGRIVVLCDTADNAPDALALVRRLFEAIGMRIVTMASKEHDRHAAFISHMPHAISYALANSVLSQEDKQSILTMAAGGFRDMSRLAKSSATMWIDIFKQNKNALLDSLTVFTREVEKAKTLIGENRWDELKAWMAQANTLHEIFKPPRNNRKEGQE